MEDAAHTHSYILYILEHVTCCKRQQDGDLRSILNPATAVEYLLIVHKTESDARRIICTFLLQDMLAFLNSSSFRTLLWQRRQSHNGPYLRNGCTGQTGTKHPDCSITSQPSTLFHHPAFKSDSSGFEPQQTVACFNLAN